MVIMVWTRREGLNELVIATAEDLHRMYPELIPCNPTSKTKERNTHEGLICFYDVLRCIGESWITDKKKRDKFKHINTGTSPLKELVEVVVAMLECINKAARKRFDTMDEDEPKRDSYSSRSISIKRKSIDYNLAFASLLLINSNIIRKLIVLVLLGLAPIVFPVYYVAGLVVCLDF
ncbi:hypothetical protein Droror1_Dr00009638 [Drosera rotundifolia]